MPRFHPKRWGWSVAVLAVLSMVAAAARAVPISGNIQFTGIDGWGVSQQTAADSGIPIIAKDASFLRQAPGLQAIHDLNEASVDDGPPATARADWRVKNNTGSDLNGSLYLVFAKPLEGAFVNDPAQDVDYAPTDVGLTLQNGMGGFDWVIFQVPNGADLYYYPAVSLGSLGIDQTTASPFAVNYILDNPEILLHSTGFELGIPKWHLLAAFVPIPEPSTLPLIVVGIGLLAVRRRRRS